MRARGKVLRAAGSHPGLLMIAGRQYWFSAEMWSAAGELVPGSEVEVEVGDAMQVLEFVPASDVNADCECASAAQAREQSRRRLLRWAFFAAIPAVLLLMVWVLISLEL